MKVAALLSSGKDSMYALQKAKEAGHDIVCLLTMKSKNQDSWMFHTPNVHLVEVQAHCLGIPLLVQETAGEKEAELEDLKKLITRAKEEYHIEGVISGALHSQYQWKRIDTICGNLELMSIAPLWKYDQEQLLRELLAHKYEIIIVAIACDGLSEQWLGRTLNTAAINELVMLNKKIGINVAGEGGEYESLVLDCHLFTKRIMIVTAHKEMENQYTGRLNITKTRTVQKGTTAKHNKLFKLIRREK